MSMFYELMMKKKGDIPTRYQKVEYIQSTGTQHIDTEILPTAEIDFICEVAFTNLSVGRYGTVASDNKRFYFGVNNSYFIGANSASYNHTIMSADTNKHNFKLNSNGLYIDDTLVYSSTGSYPTGTRARTLYLFKLHANTTYASQSKCYSAIIKQNGNIIRDYIPVYDTIDEKYGMWEKVQKKFCGNDGTGDFLGE